MIKRVKEKKWNTAFKQKKVFSYRHQKIHLTECYDISFKIKTANKYDCKFFRYNLF